MNDLSLNPSPGREGFKSPPLSWERGIRGIEALRYE